MFVLMSVDVAGGYVLTRPVPAPDYGEPGLLPESIRTVSGCLARLGFEYWWSEGNAADAVDFGVGPDQIDQLVAWYRERFEKDLGAPNIAFSTAVIREFLDTFVANPDDLIILGCGLTSRDAERILASFPTPENMGEYGVRAMLERKQPLEPGGAELGYEVLSYEYGLEHSWLCNRLEDDALAELGVSPNPVTGLLDSHQEATAVAEWINAGSIGAEPGLWLPWLIVEYETWQSAS